MGRNSMSLHPHHIGCSEKVVPILWDVATLNTSKWSGILKMLLLHRQAVLVRIGGKVGGIVTWADVLDLRKTKKVTDQPF
jgi:predicted transcriptional regulator